MSDLSKKARAMMRAKANKMGGTGDPHKKVDASGWTPPESLNTTAKTGARPVRARIYKVGGRVQGDRGPRRADRKARATGGSVVNDYINRDGVAANAKLGKPHVGAFKKGGRTKRADGGPTDDLNPKTNPNMRPGSNYERALMEQAKKEIMPRDTFNSPPGSGPARPYKKGGRTGRDMGGAAGMPMQPVPPNRMDFGPANRPTGMMAGLKKGGAAKHSDEAADKKLVKRMVEKSALKRKDGGKASGTYFGGTRPTGGRMPHAKGGAAHPADCTCARCSGGRAERASGGRAKKGKTNINIHINTPQGQSNAMPMPPMGMPMKPPQMPLPMPPQGGPGGAPPMGLAGPPPGGPPPGMPPMGHKRGGRAKGGMVHMTAGAGGARGRLEKVKIQENSRR